MSDPTFDLVLFGLKLLKPGLCGGGYNTFLDSSHEVSNLFLYFLQLAPETFDISGVSGLLLYDFHCFGSDPVNVFIGEDILDGEGNYRLLYPVLFLNLFRTRSLSFSVNALVVVM